MPVHQVLPLPIHHPQLTHRPTRAVIQNHSPRAQARVPIRVLTARTHGIGIRNAGAVSPVGRLMELKESVAAVQGDDHLESAGGDARLIVCFRVLR